MLCLKTLSVDETIQLWLGMNECGGFWNYYREKTNYLEKYLSQGYVIHHKSQTEGLRIEPGLQYLPQPWHGS